MTDHELLRRVADDYRRRSHAARHGTSPCNQFTCTKCTLLRWADQIDRLADRIEREDT